MHLIVPFAGVLSEAGRHAASTLALPRLERLLARCAPAARVGSNERSLSAPHELALAMALGWRVEDGTIPWAAWRAAADGITTGDRPWGLLTPVHLHLGAEQVVMTNPEALGLNDAESRALFDAVRPFFDSEGFALHWGAPLRWYASHDSLAALPTASLDRVIGRNIDPWMPEAPAARLVRRLQSEVQMLLHEHGLNLRREAADLPMVNSLWLSGCGVAPATPAGIGEPALDARLRTPALAEDWVAWREAWLTLDAGPIAALVSAPDGSVLTLAGERYAASFTRAPLRWWQRWRHASVAAVLESL